MATCNYFIFNGEKYYIGTIVELNSSAPHPYPYVNYAIFDNTLFTAMVSPQEVYMNGKWAMSLKEKNIVLQNL